MSKYSRKRASGFDEVERLPTSIVILLFVLAVLLIGGGVGLAYLSIIGQMNAHMQATATAQANTVVAFAAATARAKAASTAKAANANATGTAQANINATAVAAATATAQINANATATASVIAANPDTYPPGGGILAFFDPLRDNNQGHNWDTNATNCAFSGGTYHVSAPDTTRFFASCAARSTNFSNFIYEVQMTIIKGDVGGIIFRADSTNKTFYLFYVTQAGRYALRLCPGITCHDIVPATPSPAINLGLNKPNLVAVVAIGNTITLFVNHMQVAQVTDSMYNHGQIGLVASAFATAGHPTEVVYSNARVWTL